MLKIKNLITLTILITLTNSFIIQFNQINKPRCFIYRPKNSQISIIYKIMSETSKKQIIPSLTDLDTEEELDINQYLTTNDSKIFNLNFEMAKNYKFCLKLDFLINPVFLEINWIFEKSKKFLEKRQISKSIALAEKLKRESRILNVNLESEYFVLKRKVKEFERSKVFLSWVTAVKVVLVVSVAVFQVVMVLKAMKMEKYQNI